MTTFAPFVNPAVDDLVAVLEGTAMPTNPALRQAAALIRALKLTDEVPFDPANPKYEDFAALLDVEKAARAAVLRARLAMLESWVAEAGSLPPVAEKLGLTKQALSRMIATERKRVAEQEGGPE